MSRGGESSFVWCTHSSVKNKNRTKSSKPSLAEASFCVRGNKREGMGGVHIHTSLGKGLWGAAGKLTFYPTNLGESKHKVIRRSLEGRGLGGARRAAVVGVCCPTGRRHGSLRAHRMLELEGLFKSAHSVILNGTSLRSHCLWPGGRTRPSL